MDKFFGRKYSVNIDVYLCWVFLTGNDFFRECWDFDHTADAHIATHCHLGHHLYIHTDAQTLGITRKTVNKEKYRF